MRAISGSTLLALIGDGYYPRSYCNRTNQGRKRTITAAQQKRDKLKRKNKR